jgi:ATP-dependent DNA helicase Rep
LDLSTLNGPQRDAVEHGEGPLLILAGAGSGKTRVVTFRIAHLISQRGVEPGQIMAVTFTNKAAGEMRERVNYLLGKEGAKNIWIGTFHALCLRILKIENPEPFTIYDEEDCKRLIKECQRELNLDEKTIKADQLMYRIEGAKNELIDDEEYAKLATDFMTHLVAKVYTRFQKKLAINKAVDFGDLILSVVKLFDRKPEILAKYKHQFRYVMVDEYQDINHCQYGWIRRLVGDTGNLTVVGDDDQSIYMFRGADLRNILEFERDFPTAKVIKLEQNYRSTVRILQAANTLIANNEKLFDKKLWSDLGHGVPITVTACKDGENEAETVVMKLQAHKFEHRTVWADYAILYRSNHQARAIEQHLRNQRIPYLLSGGQSFFEKAEIKDITSYLRLLANQDDDPAFIRAVTTPKRGVGGATLEALGQYAGERHISLFAAAFEEGFAHRVTGRQLEPLLEFCEFINRMEWRATREPAQQVIPDLLQAIAYETWLYDHEEPRAAESKWGNVQEFTNWLMKKGEEEGKTLVDLTQTIALINMLEKQDKEGGVDAIQLSTLHASKGLEYKHVFLVGVEEGILPHRESMEPPKLEEERRLMYVGITRARQSLHLTYCEKRKQGKDLVPCEASRFITEMGKDELKFFGGKASEAVDRATGTARLDALKAMLASSKKPG